MCSFSNVIYSLVKSYFRCNAFKFKLDDVVYIFIMLLVLIVLSIESLIVRNDINILCFVYIYF